ncbi:hypothetical protein TIFTF001_007040 [Ficus carica]|uniref:Uncharacterized protein n=1 Tax=Ficus carica TaxID=3494 RepID=A0AA87ZSE3_FICCA|nr:hypothetical protein TIFTF001_007040 [Ficus carica]
MLSHSWNMPSSKAKHPYPKSLMLANNPLRGSPQPTTLFSTTTHLTHPYERLCKPPHPSQLPLRLSLLLSPGEIVGAGGGEGGVAVEGPDDGHEVGDVSVDDLRRNRVDDDGLSPELSGGGGEEERTPLCCGGRL